MRLRVGRRGHAADCRRGGAAVLVVLWGLTAAAGAQTTRRSEELPEAPSATLAETREDAAASAGRDVQEAANALDPDSHGGDPIARAPAVRPCPVPQYPPDKMPLGGPPPCVTENPIEPIVTAVNVQPLSSNEKGVLAFKEFLDPFNFVTIAAYSGIAVAWNSHSAYGPAFKGWARLTGYGLVESAQADFFGTYAIPALTHEDPRYHRMPTASVKRRLWHAVAHTVVSQSDEGRPMLNYSTLLTYPISAELSNLYVPGIPTNARATGRRVAIGYATDPVPQIVAEFLPDVAKHIHIHAQFAQELIDRAAGVNPAGVQ